MTTAPNLIVAGDPILARKLRNSGRFPAVFEVASATELRDLSKSGAVRFPAAFMFAPEFNEDLHDANVPLLANRLAASGSTVLVHAYFTQRGDLFSPEVIANTEPMSLSDLLTTLGSPRPDLRSDLQPEPPPHPWTVPGSTPARPAGESPAQSQATISGEPSPTPVEVSLNKEKGRPAHPDGESPARPPATVDGEPSPEPAEVGRVGGQGYPEPPAGYSELSIVHRGVSAVTYRAVHEGSGAVVSLRVWRDGTETPPSELAALERASRSDHVVTILENGHTTSGQRYTVSVHCTGGSHAGGPPLTIEDAVGIVVAVGKGLQALHDVGLVHGDVHPGHILRGAEGPLLTGAATMRGLAVHSGPGTLEPVNLERIDPGFAAPEVLRQQALTAAADVYGLGATLWSLLAGHAPFRADDRWAVQERALPRVPRDDVPEWLVNVLAKATAHEAADRYPTAQAFRKALAKGPANTPARTMTDQPNHQHPTTQPQAQPPEDNPPNTPAQTTINQPTAQPLIQALEEKPPNPPAQTTTDQPPDHHSNAQPAEENLSDAPARTMTDEPAADRPVAQPLVQALGEKPPGASAQAVTDHYTAAQTFTEAVIDGTPGSAVPSVGGEILPGWSWEEGPEPSQDDGVFRELYAAPAPGSAGRGRRRVPLLAALVALVLGVAGIGAFVMLTGAGTEEQPPRAEPTQVPVQKPSTKHSQVPRSKPTPVRPGKEFVPGQVKIVDGRVSIEVTWTDASGGRATHYVVGGPAGRTPSTLATAKPGVEKAVVSAINPSVNYCLTVVAVVDVDQVAHSEPVCTKRDG